MQTQLNFLAAFIVVLAMIGLAVWLFRRFAGNNLGANANRGRMPRLAVVDAALLGDGRRRLVLVRRDNVEHLLMIGGPTDVVVEPNIVRAMPARDGAPGRPGELPRTPSLTDSPGWNEAGADDLDAVEAPVEQPPPSRRAAPTFADEVRRPMPPPDRRTSEPTSLAPDMPTPRAEAPARAELPNLPTRPPRPRPEAPPAAAGPRGSRLAETLGRIPRLPEAAPAAPAPAPSAVAAPAAPTPSADAEKELTDMAQRLEAALRRPSAPPVAAPSAEPSAASVAPPVERPRPLQQTSSAPPVAAPEPAAAPPAAPRSGFENLEDEMASLLGRPKSPS